MDRTRTDSTPQARTDDAAETASGPPVLELDSVTRTFGDEAAVEDFSLSVPEGELLTLLGPSGCGKTTTLRLLAGLDRPDEGAIRVRDDVVAGGGRFVPPEERNVGLIFQDFALFPHLTVAENVAFGIQDCGDDEIERRVDDLLDLVDLADYRDHHPDSLSGGQKQRIALARSLAPEPDVLLLDEPFSNLDVALRKEMRQEVRRILKDAGVTAISVTHDQEEALSISDRIGVIHDGHLEQVGPPERVFQHPQSRFVAEFLGETGFVTGQVEDDRVDTALGEIDAGMVEGLSPAYEGSTIDVLVRPDDLRAVPTDDGDANGRIVSRQYTGPSFVYRVELDSGDVVHCSHNHVDRFGLDRSVRVDLAIDHTLAWFPAG
ncbi:MAG: ABC transporter ATP-binding protein [Haloarculaceae archaeon]